MRKRLHERIEDFYSRPDKNPTMEDELNFGHWKDPVILTQEINKELYELNVGMSELLKNLKFLLGVVAAIMALLFLKFG
jgi:hypothetical protein